jgi:hypothetical protein
MRLMLLGISPLRRLLEKLRYLLDQSPLHYNSKLEGLKEGREMIVRRIPTASDTMTANEKLSYCS